MAPNTIRSPIPGSAINSLSEKQFPEALGFRNGNSSVHTSRTMMLSELSIVMEHVEPTATPDEYACAIKEENILGKPTQATRSRSAQRLVELYSLDKAQPIFRLLRHFWRTDPRAQPLLAFVAACARDPLLRTATPFVISIAPGELLDSLQISEQLKYEFPGRFSQSTLMSTSQNLASSWTQAGYLCGKSKKRRSHPVATPVVVTLALALGYLCGSRGKALLDTIWARTLDCSPGEIASLAGDASKQGWMTYKSAGAVVEITFPGLLTAQEERVSRESD